MRVRPVTRESEGEGIPNRRDDPARRVRTDPLLVGESFEFVEQGLYLTFYFVPDFTDGLHVLTVRVYEVPLVRFDAILCGVEFRDGTPHRDQVISILEVIEVGDVLGSLVRDVNPDLCHGFDHLFVDRVGGVRST